MSVPRVFQNILSTTCDECGNTVIIIHILSRHSIGEAVEVKTSRAFKAPRRTACDGLLM
jgi:hypothetical protein